MSKAGSSNRWPRRLPGQKYCPIWYITSVTSAEGLEAVGESLAGRRARRFSALSWTAA
jgi:hypothetical protein